MAAGYTTLPPLPLGISAPVITQAGYPSFTALWMGGAGVVTAIQGGYPSFTAFWLGGGGGGVGEIVPPALGACTMFRDTRRR